MQRHLDMGPASLAQVQAMEEVSNMMRTIIQTTIAPSLAAVSTYRQRSTNLQLQLKAVEPAAAKARDALEAEWTNDNELTPIGAQKGMLGTLGPMTALRTVSVNVLLSRHAKPLIRPKPGSFELCVIALQSKPAAVE